MSIRNILPLALCVCCHIPIATSAGEKPNIVFVLFDDMGWGQPQSYDAKSALRTPHLDRLAAEGMRFTDAHSAASVCTPTRYGLLTGRYPWRIGQFGVLTTYSPPIIPATRLTVAKMLQQHGYHTACVGKWHLGLNWVDGKPGRETHVPLDARYTDGPNAVGFDYFCGFTHARNIGTILEQDRVIAHVEPVDNQPFLLRKALSYIEERAKAAQPFFLYFPMCPPHEPLVPSDDYVGKSGADDVVRHDPKYGDWVYQGDAMLGQILETLEKHQLVENTLVIATSDNGAEHRPYPPLRESKRSIYEGGHRVPFVVRWPRHVPAGSVADQTICLNDFVATAAEIIGTSLPPDAAEDSVSFLKTLQAQDAGSSRREGIVHQSSSGDLAVRHGPWKQIFFKDGRRELYHLEENLAETQDRIAEHPEMGAKLTQLMQRYIDSGRSTPGAPQQNEAAISLKGKASAKKKGKPKARNESAGSSAPEIGTAAAKTKEDTSENPPSAAADEFEQFGIYAQSAPRPAEASPVVTSLPLPLEKGDRVAFIGNTLLERAQEFGHFEAMLQQQFPNHELVVRPLAWSADEIDVQPRPANFADTEQHLTHEQADVIFAAFGFNESFAGEEGLDEFRRKLTQYVSQLKSKAFNGRTASRIVLISPIANENVRGVAAADLNNDRIKRYVEVMRDVADQQKIGFADVFEATNAAMQSPGSDLTINGIHLTAEGDQIFSTALFQQVFGVEPPDVRESVRTAVVEKNREYFRRFRPVNTFYYTGGRNKAYGYLDFLPAMRNFDIMVANRDRVIWDMVQGKASAPLPDDSNVPPLPQSIQSRGANEWLSAAEELKAFQIDARFDVNLFAGEEQFPDIANPIQMRWDSRGRLWVSCSTTYPHVYPGNQPNDKLVILEDLDGDGQADKSTVFADDLHIPLSFEFGDGGVYVSEQPCLSFLQDTDGDDRADVHRTVLSGFGTEDSHHALHDFTWTPDGDLIFRESVFHHSQVETPYGPVRQQNSGWFRFQPRTQRLISFGTYSSTNPWGVTFDDWGQHVASHPVYAAAFHAIDPPYPQQHPSPKGLQAYSGVCGHEFVDFATFPQELQGGFIKVRYKPTNRVEIHKWVEGPFGYNEEYVGDLLFSTNLSFIPVDLQFGPRGDLFVCDWYNPVKGHMQYSLRDERRDRHSGRIWRITAKDRPTQEPPRIADATIEELLENLKRPEYRVRYWSKRELRERDPVRVKAALDGWITQLDPSDSRYRHHQLEAVWTYRWIGATNTGLLVELLACDDHHARAAATQQLRYWHTDLPNAVELLRRAANDENGIVRMEAAIAASYIGTQDAFEAMRDVLKHPREGHVAYAIACALGSRTLRPYWENHPEYGIARLLRNDAKAREIKEPTPNASEAQFDNLPDLKLIKISCVPERMLFTVHEFTAKPGQPVKLLFTNPDATDHNLVIVKPGALAEVGMAANDMAKDPRNANSDFVPPGKRDLILHATKMIGPTRPSLIHVLRFEAPAEPGIYPYVCTFPGHWVVMNGVMVVASDEEAAKALLAASQPQIVNEWKMADFQDFASLARRPDDATVMRGMQAFVKARCNQCHVVAGHGVNLGPDLKESIKKLKGAELLKQILEPSSQIHERFQNVQFITTEGRVVTGVIVKEDAATYQVATNLLTPNTLTTVRKKDVDERIPSKISPMPTGLLNVLTKDEILDLHAYLEAGGFQLPDHLKDHHNHQHGR